MKMKTKTIIIIVAISLVFLLCAIALPSLFNGDENSGTSSPASPPSNVSEPEENSKPENIDSYTMAVQTILNNTEKIKTAFSEKVNEEYIEQINQTLGSEAVEGFADALLAGELTSENMRTYLGYSEKAFLALMENQLYRTSVLENNEDRSTEMVFVGDVSFADGYSVLNHYISREKGVEGLVSDEVLEILRTADITMANNEFTFTERGYPIPDKKFTFRSNPKNVEIYHEMGVDIVGLANNHAFDYGPDSLADTLTTLDGAGIPHVGAGENLEDAKAPYYYIINGFKIAICAGSAIDPWSTRGAKDDQSGVFQIFDTDSMCEVIEEAKREADFVIAYVHWGVENTTNLTGGQKSMGKAFVDSGADVVIGMHSHCMQGLEYYKGKLIVYSLGNFTFSSKSLTCGMLKVNISDDGEITNVFYPMMQSGNFTYINSGEDGASQFELLKEISINVNITEDFIVTDPKKDEGTEE